ncbi:MAG: KH domain-containing protein [Clostridia bacterium]|nr:KH domain-containing protein [Clostridia bacterium]
MVELVEYLVKQLVVNEDAVSVKVDEHDDEVTVHITVSSEDMGKVIGKNGRVASSIRTIVRSIFAKNRKKIYLKFGE